MTVSDNTIAGESLDEFYKSLGKSSLKVGKKLARNVLKGRNLNVGYYGKPCYCCCEQKP